MTDIEKKNTLVFINKILDKPDARVSFCRPPVEAAPKDGWAVFECGETIYMLIAAGPVQEDREKEVRAMLTNASKPAQSEKATNAEKR